MAAHSLRARFKETVSEAILDATEELAAEVGAADASLQAIAQRAGIAVGTIYNHFQDRNELFIELFERRRSEFVAALDEAAKRTAREGFEAQLNAYVYAVFAYFDKRRAFLKLALDGQAPTAAQVVRRTGRAKQSKPVTVEQMRLHAERIVRVGLKEKRLKSEGSDLSALFLTGALREVLVTRVEAPQPMVEQTAKVIALFLKGASR